eukprot:SAG31_NODE_1753_length_7350_cov_1.885395_4_plen_826_part_00
MSQEKLDPWMPFRGRGSDIVVLCTQECTYDARKDAAQAIVGTLAGKIVGAQGFPVDERAKERYCTVELLPVDCTDAKRKVQISSSPVHKNKPNPKWDHSMTVEFKDDTYDFFRIYPDSARLSVVIHGQTSSTFGKKSVVIAEGEILLDLSAEAAQFRQIENVKVELRAPGSSSSKDSVLGTVTLQLHVNMHVELSRLRGQHEEVLAAAANQKVQEPSSIAEDTPTPGTLSVTVVSAHIHGDSASDNADAMCQLTLGSDTHATDVAEGTNEPTWNHSMNFLCMNGYSAQSLVVELFDVAEDGQTLFDTVTMSLGELSKATLRQNIKLTCGATGSTIVLNFCFAALENEPVPEATPAGNEQEDANPDGSHFFHTVKCAAGDEYYEVGREVLWQMMMIVFAKKTLRPHITSVEITKVATGIAGIVANKGGTVFKLVYKGCALAFVNTHLAAHETMKHCLERNAMAEVVQRVARVGNKAFDIGNQFQHSFWAGDLNYRVEFADWTTQDVPKAKKLLQVKQLIKKERWDILRAADELQREMAAGHVFAGFRDSTCAFPPTFKVEKGFELEYNSKRVPSFCDRILWRSSRGFENCIHQEFFSAAPNLTTSDHKPCWARFRLSIPPSLKVRDRQQPSRVLLRLRGVEVEGLYTNTSLATLEIHDADGLFNGVIAMKDLSGGQSIDVVTRACSIDALCGQIDDPTGAATSVFFAHSVSLKVVEDGNFGTQDLGYATLDLRREGDMSAVPSTEDVKAVEATRPGWQVVRPLHSQWVRRSLRLPLSLNGQALPTAYLTGTLELIELFRPVWSGAHTPTHILLLLVALLMAKLFAH